MAETGQSTKQMDAILKNLETIINGDVKSISELSANLKESGISLEQFRKGLVALQNAGSITAEDLAFLNAELIR